MPTVRIDLASKLDLEACRRMYTTDGPGSILHIADALTPETVSSIKRELDGMVRITTRKARSNEPAFLQVNYVHPLWHELAELERAFTSQVYNRIAEAMGFDKVRRVTNVGINLFYPGDRIPTHTDGIEYINFTGVFSISGRALFVADHNQEVEVSSGSLLLMRAPGLSGSTPETCRVGHSVVNIGEEERYSVVFRQNRDLTEVVE